MTTNRSRPSKNGVTLVTGCLIVWSATGCPNAGSDPTTEPSAPLESFYEGSERSDGARRIEIPTSGSTQNPAWSPDGSRLLLTRFRNGYKRDPADLLLFDLRDGSLISLQDDGSENVNLPGSAWDALAEVVVFSSSRGPHDKIYRVSVSRLDSLTQVTSREDAQAFEPSFSPDGHMSYSSPIRLMWKIKGRSRCPGRTEANRRDRLRHSGMIVGSRTGPQPTGGSCIRSSLTAGPGTNICQVPVEFAP